MVNTIEAVYFNGNIKSCEKLKRASSAEQEKEREEDVA